jgi:hypothetical protein
MSDGNYNTLDHRLKISTDIFSIDEINQLRTIGHSKHQYCISISRKEAIIVIAMV